MDKLLDFRCECGKLLAKVSETARLEVKCPRCHRLNRHPKNANQSVKKPEKAD